MKTVKLQREIEISNFQGLYIVKFNSKEGVVQITQQENESILDFTQRIGMLILSTVF